MNYYCYPEINGVIVKVVLVGEGVVNLLYMWIKERWICCKWGTDRLL
jgi:hypothetical protein